MRLHSNTLTQTGPTQTAVYGCQLLDICHLSKDVPGVAAPPPCFRPVQGL